MTKDAEICLNVRVCVRACVTCSMAAVRRTALALSAGGSTADWGVKWSAAMPNSSAPLGCF